MKYNRTHILPNLSNIEKNSTIYNNKCQINNRAKIVKIHKEDERIDIRIPGHYSSCSMSFKYVCSNFHIKGKQ